jgi:hypothetical protein
MFEGHARYRRSGLLKTWLPTILEIKSNDAKWCQERATRDAFKVPPGNRPKKHLSGSANRASGTENISGMVSLEFYFFRRNVLKAVASINTCASAGSTGTSFIPSLEFCPSGVFVRK